ncbi:hypothetical protein chiPu_0019882, partial [Chiloscyllium punctatum]|nr:hypothetical protein [Chiloscyllium punctatum]
MPITLLRAEITTDRKLQIAQRKQKLLIKAALKDIILFRTHHIWLTTTYQMLCTWSADELEKLRDWKLQQYQVNLMQLRKWLRRMRGFEPLYVTRNRVLALDCSIIHEKMMPSLKSMQLDILSFSRKECEQRTEKLISDLSTAIKELQDKPIEDVAFALYSSKIEHLWGTFLREFKEASEFTIMQRDSIIDNLEQRFRLLSSEVHLINVNITSGPFLDPSQNAVIILQQLLDMRIKFWALNEALGQLSKSRNILKGEPFDLAFLTLTEKNITFRQALWNLFFSSSQEIKDWKKTMYEKLDLNQVMNMLDQWFLTLDQLRKSLPPDDEILHIIEETLLQFKNVLPILMELHCPEIQERHWKAIFIEMGETWIPVWDMTLADLLSYDFPSYSDFIAQILIKAKKEFELQKLLRSVEILWQHYEFKFVTHIAVIHYHDNEGGKHHQPQESWAAKNSGTLTLIEMERVRWQTEDSLMTLSMIVSTTAPGNIQEEAEKLMEMIQHFGELLDLWKMFQDKWVFLHQVFYEMELNARKPDPNLMKKIEKVDGLYRRVIQALSSNPSVLSVILSQDTKKYQGMTLRMIFSTGIEAMEQIILQMNHLLESARQEFSRLYFLSDDDLLHLLTLSSDPRKLLPFVTKCFRGIQDLEYQVISSPNLIIPPRVNVLAIHGDLQERVNLTPRLEAIPKTIPWLRNLELRIQQSLFLSLESCVAERTALAREINSKIVLESSGRSEAYKAAQLMKSILKLANSFPVQCILIAEDFCWLSDVKKVLLKRSVSKEWFKTLYNTKIDRLVMIVRGLCKHSWQEADNPRVLFLLKCLICKSMNHRDISDNLIASNIQSEASFEWHKFIKYQFDFNWIFPKRESLKPSTTHFGHSVPGSNQSKFGLRCYINLLGNNYYYDYEYVGPKSVCVQNPVTEKMCLAMILALQNFNPCALIGTYGTGKSSTISHLAQVFGYQLVIFQCCKDMSLAFINRIFNGAIQSGAWLVLENTDSLPMGMLSVLGQQLTSIQNSYRELTTKDISDRSYTDYRAGPNRKKFGTSLVSVTDCENLHTSYRYTWSSECQRQFDPTSLGSIVFAGNIIPARVNYGTFVTLQRFDSSLSIPENLRLSLRPVSVIEPDLKVIIEMKLTSIGFLKASNLSRKVLTIFELVKDSGSITDCCFLPLMEKVIDIAADVLYQTLQAKIPEPSNNQSKRFSNVPQPPASEGQDEQKGKRGEGVSDRGRVKSDSVEQCLLVSQQPITNSTRKASESEEFSGNVSAPVFKSILLVEEHAILKALILTLFPAVSDQENLLNLKGLLTDLFSQSCIPSNNLESDSQLLSVIEKELADTDHHVTKQLVNNILVLYQTLKVSKGVIMVGCSGSGKTTSYKTLSRTLNLLARNEPKLAAHQSESTDPSYRTVQVSVCFPNSLSTEELLGAMDHQSWKNGIVSKWLSEIKSWSQARSLVKEFESPQVKPYHCPEPLRWMVLDGELCLDWLGPISSLLTHKQSLTLSNGDQISFIESTSLILEVTDLSNAPPSAVTWCNMVHYQGSHVWEAVLANLVEKIYSNYSVPRNIVKLFTRLGQDLIPKTMAFLEQHCVPALTQQADYSMIQQNQVAQGLQEVMAFKNILKALLDKHLLRDQQQEDTAGVEQTIVTSQHQRARLDDSILPKNYILAKNILAVAFIWSFGGHLHTSSWPQFDQFARQALSSSDYNIDIPSEGLVFDYYIDPDTGCLASLFRHNESEKKKSKVPAYVLIPEFQRYVKLLELLLLSGCSTLLVGEQLSGKTSFVQAVKGLISYPTIYRLPISTNTQPRHARCYLTEKVFTSGQQELSLSSAVTADAKAKALFFLDDIHAAPFKVGSGCQPVIETFRHSLTCHGSYDGNCQQFRYFHSAHVNYIMTCAPLRGRMGFVSSRFTRLFTVLALPEMTSAMLTAIYTPCVTQWLNNFPTYTLARHAVLAHALVSATVELYHRVRQTLKPSPSRAHYLFSMADIGAVLNGMFLMNPASITMLVKPKKGKLKRSGSRLSSTILSVTKIIIDLWLHESMRTFSDCLLIKEDKKTLTQILEEVAQFHFCTSENGAESLQTLQEVAESSIEVTSLSQSNVAEFQQIIIPVSLEEQSADRSRETSGDGGREPGVIANLDPKSQLPQPLQLTESGSKISSKSSEQAETTKRDYTSSEVQHWLTSVSESQTNDSKTRSHSPAGAPRDNPGTESEISVQKKHKHARSHSRKTKRSETLKPLFPPHLLRSEESLVNLIYSKLAVRPVNKQQMSSPKWNPYREVNCDTIAQQLQLIVQKQNHKNKTNYQIIFFNECVYHFVRIYRVLCTPRSHCTLLSLTNFSGRKTLVRLAAYLTMADLFEINGEMSRLEIAKVIKQASYGAGIHGKDTVILVHGALRKDIFQDLNDMMAEGKYPELYTAIELEELAKMFANIRRLPLNVKREQVMERMGLGLDKIQQLYKEAEEYMKYIDNLKHKLNELAEIRRQLIDRFGKVKGEFIDLISKCRDEEFRIALLMRELEAAQKKFDEEFGTVKPIYATALKALQSLNSANLDEIRTYRAPPPPVVMVMNTLCLMFGKPEGWENAKQLIGQPNFYQELEFYDKDNIQESVHKALGDIVDQPEFQPEVVREASQALESFSLWIKAIYQYSSLVREYSPSFVNEYQSRIEEAQLRLGLLRKQTFEMKKKLVALLREDGDDYLSDSDSVTDLSDIEVLRLVEQKEQDALQALKADEDIHLAEMAKWQQKLTEAEDLMRAMNPHQYDWDVALKQAENRRMTVSGDSLLTAAAIVYLSPFGENLRQELLKKWEAACYTGEIQMEPEDVRQELVKLLPEKTFPASQEKAGSDTEHHPASKFIPTRSDFLLLDILSSLGEQLKWNRAKLPVNATARVSVLLTRILTKYCPLPIPLFIDPDYQCRMWLQVLQEGGGPRLNRELLGVPADNPFPEEEEGTMNTVTGESLSNRIAVDILTGEIPVEEEEIDWVPESVTEKPPNNIWVYPITTEKLDHIVLTAASNGIALMVTNIERKPFTLLLKKLLKVQTWWSPDQPWELTFGKLQIEVKPTFRLYLSTSLPLRIFSLEFDRTFLKQVRVLSFTISKSGLQELFLKEVLYFDRDRPSNVEHTQQMDTMYLQHQLQVTQEELMDKVVQTATSLLNDRSIQTAAVESQDTKEQIHGYLKTLNPSKRTAIAVTEDPYVTISNIGSEMYWALIQICRLNPLYYFSKTSFIKVVREILTKRNLKVRSLGTGTCTDHFMDLMYHLMSELYKYLRWCLFVQHARLYRFLVAVGHMKVMNTVTKLEWELFLRGTQDLKYDVSAQSTCVLKPSWVSQETWDSCCILELLPAFQNLRISIAKKANQWREYFGLSSTVISAIPCSSFAHLNTFQRAILWKFFQPHKLSVIMNDVVSCELGGTLTRDLRPTTTSLFNYSWQNVPVMFLLPEDGSLSLSTHPFYWIEQMAREHQMHNKVHVISCGAHDDVDKVRNELQLTMSKGRWLILNNCHLLEHWDSELLNILLQLTTTYKAYLPTKGASITVSKYDVCEVLEEETLTVLTNAGLIIHRDFRLWLICKNDSAVSLPGMTVYSGHLLDREDQAALDSIINHCLTSSEGPSSKGIRGLITLLIGTR